MDVKSKKYKYKNLQDYINDHITIEKNGCWLWRGYHGKTYPKIKFRHWHLPTHRFFYAFFKGEIPKGMCVCHTCDVRHCVNPDHLWLGTYNDNNVDCVKKGRDNPPRGEINGQSKLTDEDIKKIFELRKQGKLLKEISTYFNICISQICEILNKKAWRHLWE